MIYIENQEIIPTIFPDNTSQVWKLGNIRNMELVVTWEFRSESEFLHLAQLKDLLSKQNNGVGLIIKYLPYGRQDKEVSDTATFALRTFAKLLNSLDFNFIEILDPHSDEAIKLINRSYAVYPKSELNDAISVTNSQTICYPDKGALSKYSQVYEYNYIYGEKVRNQLTGNIESYNLVGDCLGKKVMIVDDICDGGMTFKLLADQLYDAGAEEVNLFVTHGIFSKGLRPLTDSGIKRIFDKTGEQFNQKDKHI